MLRRLALAAVAGLPWRFPRRFGLLEVVLYTAGGSLDFVRRHLAIVNELERDRRRLGLETVDVLDFGGGHSPLATFIRLYGLADHYRMTVVDIAADAIEAARLEAPLFAKHVVTQDGSLPFPARSFDIVVSSDVFEHIPSDRRADWAHELDRVARHAQIHNVPCDGGEFASSQADTSYQAWHVAQFGEPEPWTAEHLENGAPTLTELMELFPGSSVAGLANVEMWLATMKSEGTGSSRFRRLRRGMAYAAQGYRRDRVAPYKAAFVTWRRTTDREPRPPDAPVTARLSDGGGTSAAMRERRGPQPIHRRAGGGSPPADRAAG